MAYSSMNVSPVGDREPMSAQDNFEIDVSTSATDAFALLTGTPAHKHIPAPGEQTTLPDGSRVVANAKGQLVYVSYSEGSTMMRFKEYVICSDALSNHWFGTRKMDWMRLD